MIKLNLVDPENSDLKYEILKFPDGQQNIVIDFSSHFIIEGTKEERFYQYGDVEKRDDIQIVSRFNSFKDLELILCATKAMHRLGIEHIHLYIPYLLGARSDRKFQEGGNSYLVDVIAPIINAQDYCSVEVMDIHSDVAAACINNLENIDNYELFDWALEDLYDNGYVLVAPDAGSLKKIYNLAEKAKYPQDEIIICTKHRDKNGKLSHTSVPMNFDLNTDFIIVDDICDGGRTFIEIAKVVKANKNFKGKAYLVVTHGIFSNGFEELTQHFDGIYSTNSYADYGTAYLSKSGRSKANKLKQFNVF